MGYSVREDWEQTRSICYILAQANSKKKLKPKDIIQFSWDKEVPHLPKVTMTKEKRE